MFNMEEFNKEWERMEIEHEEMRKRNKKFRENWEKNVRDMGAASFFGLDEDPIDFDSEDIIDVEYKEVEIPTMYIETKEV